MEMAWYSDVKSTTPLRTECVNEQLLNGTYQRICDSKVPAENVYDAVCKIICDLCNMSYVLSLDREIIHTTVTAPSSVGTLKTLNVFAYITCLLYIYTISM